MGFYYNPVKLYLGNGSVNKLPEILGDRTCMIVTTSGMLTRGVIDKIKALCGNHIEYIIANVLPNPTINSIITNADECKGVEPEAIVAIGGGSVIDTAKALAAQKSCNIDEKWLLLHLRQGLPFPSSFSPIPVIAIPSTAGTGSEVTMWATLWDQYTKQKYSLSYPLLYPETAIIDPQLTLTLPKDITIATALDALSHAMEAIWNKNVNPISDAMATQAISMIPNALRQVFNSPQNIKARETLHYASLKAGLAFSNTKTAIAHSISYPLTSYFGMPHGIAASFTLPEIMRVNGTYYPDRIELISHALGYKTIKESITYLGELLNSVGMREFIVKYISKPHEIERINSNFVNPERASNNVVQIDEENARSIVLSSLKRFLAIEIK